MRTRNYLVPFIENYPLIFRELNLDFSKKTIILLKGQLGSGKTTFVKELLLHEYQFGDVNSPTFGIINTYNIKEKLIFHYDLYIINNVSELDEMGLYDNLETKAVHLIEWPEIIPQKLINANFIISFEIIDQYRLISIENTNG